MSKSLRALGLVVVAFVGLWYFTGGARSLPPVGASEVVAAPLAHENLCVYFVYGSDTVAGAKVMTLQEALERELAIVHETSDVNTLAVENRSPDCELFIQSGDIVKGGKQDRMAATDMLVPPGSGRVALPAHCVEQGRWTNRGTEDAGRFGKSDGFVVGKDMKYANASGQQSAVWQTVSDNQGKLSANLNFNANAAASPTSFQLTLESPAIKAKIAEYEAALKAAGDDRGNVVGVVFVVNGVITGAEVYGSNALFRKAWPKLLNAAAVEAVADRTNAPSAAPPTPRAIEHFLARGADPEPAGDTDTPTRRLGESRGGRGNRGNGFVTGLPDANVEIFQTEGRLPELMQTEGRAPQMEVRQPMPLPNAPPGVTTINPAPSAPQPPRGTIVAIPVLVQDNVPLIALPAIPVALPPAPPANTDGNRLSSNRTENRSTLMVESRDPARQNAVIHRSYIKK